mmetsp:Transcript_4636/g.12344  ORF Transcript_4636/g.12344 Transcript_4636/m.12344 type:complete len:209 (+) Transcript_4636:760-1386(+)
MSKAASGRAANSTFELPARQVSSAPVEFATSFVLVWHCLNAQPDMSMTVSFFGRNSRSMNRASTPVIVPTSTSEPPLATCASKACQRLAWTRAPIGKLSSGRGWIWASKEHRSPLPRSVRPHGVVGSMYFSPLDFLHFWTCQCVALWPPLFATAEAPQKSTARLSSRICIKANRWRPGAAYQGTGTRAPVAPGRRWLPRVSPSTTRQE